MKHKCCTCGEVVSTLWVSYEKPNCMECKECVYSEWRRSIEKDIKTTALIIKRQARNNDIIKDI